MEINWISFRSEKNTFGAGEIQKAATFVESRGLRKTRIFQSQKRRKAAAFSESRGIRRTKSRGIWRVLRQKVLVLQLVAFSHLYTY